MKNGLQTLWACLCLILVSSCTITRGRYHTMSSGETLKSVAIDYGLSEDELARFNENEVLQPGAKLFIPFEKRAQISRQTSYRAPNSTLAKNSIEKKDPKDETQFDRKINFSTYGLMWPLIKPVVSSGYGKRGYRMHEGIDLRAPRHTPVYAASAGKVIYASQRLSGYGRMVIVDHGRGLQTIYAHLQKMKVREGSTVKKGSVLGTVGTSGHATGPHLHFEVRNGTKAHDPMYYLPSLTPQMSAQPARSPARTSQQRNSNSTKRLSRVP